MSYFMFEKIGKKEEGCFITTLQKTACDLKQLPIQSVTLILKYFQYQGVQRGSGAKATHSCSNNTSDELVYVAHLHGVWVHSSSLLLPIAGDPPPPSLTISTHRYPRLPMETLIKHDCSDATACGRRRRACSLCVCVCLHAYTVRVWMCVLYVCLFTGASLHMSAYLLRGDKKRGKCDERAAITGRRANSDMKSTLMRERKEKKKEMQTEQKYCRWTSTANVQLSLVFTLLLPPFRLHASTYFSVWSRPGGRCIYSTCGEE